MFSGRNSFYTAKLLLEAVLNAHSMTVLQSNHLPALEYLDF
jgi:hypothetical protein